MVNAEGVMFAILGAGSWGATNVLMRKPVSRSSAVAANLVMILYGLPLILFFAAIWEDWTRLIRIDLYVLLSLAAVGLTGVGLGQSLLFQSVRMIGAARATPISSTSTMLSPVLAAFFLGEVLSTNHFSAIVLVILGVSLISVSQPQTEKAFSPASGFFSGMLFGFAAALSWALRYFFIRIVMLSLPSSLLGALLSNVIGAVSLLLLGGRRGFLETLRATDRSSRLHLLTAGVVSSLALIATFASLEILPVSVAVPVVNSYPLFTLVLSAIFFQKLESVNLKAALGCGLTVAGVGVASL